MIYTLDDLIELYAENTEISAEKAREQYKAGWISKKELLDAYLREECILGYTDTFWSIFEALKED